MIETVKRLKINKKLETKPCAWCNDSLVLGDDAAVCEACGAIHHATCWDNQDGCGEKGCVNAPFKQIEQTDLEHEAEQRKLKAFEMICPHCRAVIRAGSVICSKCRRPTDPSGIYPEELKTLAPGVQKALIQAIIGLFIFGIILGPLAIRNANQAKELIRDDITLKGEGLATVAQVIGWIAVIGWGLAILSRLLG